MIGDPDVGQVKHALRLEWGELTPEEGRLGDHLAWAQETLQQADQETVDEARQELKSKDHGEFGKLG